MIKAVKKFSVCSTLTLSALAMAIGFSANTYAKDIIDLTSPAALHGKEIFKHYGISDDLPKLALSSLTQGEHLVEYVELHKQIGDEITNAEMFLVQKTDTKGNIDLRIKYNPKLIPEGEDHVANIESKTRLEYRLRDYAQSYDPASVKEHKLDDGRVLITFNYSKYGLPQDIDYFRLMSATIEIQNGLPVAMEITNTDAFKYESYNIESYKQRLAFKTLTNGKVIISDKSVDLSGTHNKKPLAIKVHAHPVSFYDDNDGVTIIDQTRLTEVSDPRMHEVSVKLDRVFPLMGDMVRRKGIDLPLPYGVSVAYRAQGMDVPFTDFNVAGVDFNQLFDPAKSLGSVSANSLTLRGDVNILPFWNVYGVIGKVNVDATVDAEYTGAAGEALRDVLNNKLNGLGDALCDKTNVGSTLCNSGTVNVPLHLEYDVVGVGTTLSVGYKEFFASVTATYSMTKLKGNQDWGDGILTVQPMLGYQMIDWKTQFFIGAEYQGLNDTMSGSVDSVTMPDGQPFSFDVGVDLDPWAYLVGFNKNIGKHYTLTFLYNYGSTRSAGTLNFGYRW